jgi:diguanylate cyclase (GGDEF)-like protein/PAS domain S-box-containing protein
MGTIAEEHEALLQFLYLAPVGLVQMSTDGEILMLNPVSAQLLMPLSRDGGLANFFTVLGPVAPELHQLTRGFTQARGLICDGLRIQLSAGERGVSDPQVLSLSLLKLDDARLMALLGDVTMQVKRERLLRQNEAWFNAILTGISDYALVSLDAHGRVDDWNPSVARVTGFTRERVVGRPYSVFYPDDATTPDRVLDRLRDADANGWSIDDGWRVKADGSKFWGSAMIAPLRDRELDPRDVAPAADDERAYCLIIRDITDKREASENLRKATSRDHLTGIANRRAFFDAAELEVVRWHRAPRPLSMILFDADAFKAVNDTFGHPAGDAVLRHFAAALTASFREVDVVARLGGEEFAVLLPSTDGHGAHLVAERFRATIESAVVQVDGAQIRYTVSGGVAAMDDRIAGLDALMKRADEALYAAKAAGRNRIVGWASAPDAFPA